MTEATFVLFAPKAQLSRLRAHLATDPTPEVRWREKRQFAGSEFYVVGPSQLAREAHRAPPRISLVMIDPRDDAMLSGSI